jgi:hypothetical protein
MGPVVATEFPYPINRESLATLSLCMIGSRLSRRFGAVPAGDVHPAGYSRGRDRGI